MRHRLALGLALAVLVTPSPGLAMQSQSVPPPPPQIAEARELIAAGSFARAEALYAELLRNESALGPYAATTNFGYALAIQQALSVDDSVSDQRVAAVVRAYTRAAVLNPELRVSATSNLGLLYRALGEHSRAARAFVDAGDAARDSTRGALWMEAAAEYELADSARRASDFYSRVVQNERANRRAMEGLFRTTSGHSTAGAILNLAEQWIADTSLAPAIADGLLQLLTRANGRPSESQTRHALGLVAVAFTTGRLGPADFSARMRDRLLQVSSTAGPATDGAAALVDAYSARRKDSSYREPASAKWWHASTRERRAWSGMLRWLGDWHSQRNAPTLARSFYEAAVGRGGEYLTREWADAKALVPLALLYAQQSDAEATGRLGVHVTDYTERLFVGKTAAYQRNDLAAIRTFHTALGSYYASIGQWSGTDARNAEFQLNRMRTVTQQLNREGTKVSDPPDLIAKLAAYYERTGDSARADSLRTQVRQHYDLRKRPDKADSTFRRVAKPAAQKLAPRPE